MALADFIDTVTPSWAKQANRAHWWNMFRLGALLVDCLIEGVVQGRKAGLANAVDLQGSPAYGGFEDVRSLDYLAEDVGVLHGLTEVPPDLAYRIRHCLDPNAGGWAASNLMQVLEQLAGILGPNPPVMRIVNRASDWWTRNQDGSYDLVRLAGDGLHFATDGTVTQNTTVAQAWNWDSLTEPAPPSQGEAGDWWLILYAPLNTPYGTITDQTFSDLGIVGDYWNDPTTQAPSGDAFAGTVGTNAPRVLVDLIRHVIASRAVAGWTCLWIIIAFDDTSFAPDGSSATYPDGYWGYHTKLGTLGGTPTQVVARLASAEYWPGALSGEAP